jgi:hypothetical protein
LKPLARQLVRLLSIVAVLASTGCRSTYYSAAFVPATHEAVVKPDRPEGALAHAFAAVRGVRRMDKDAGTPPLVEVRMRLENRGSVPFHLEQHSLELLSGDFVPFAAAQMSSAGEPRLEPGGAINIDLSFPMPEGRDVDDVDFTSLTLSWTLVFGDTRARTSATFERRRRSPYYGGSAYYYRDPWYDDYWYHPHGNFSFYVGSGVWR